MVTKTLDGITTPVSQGVQYVIVRKGQPLQSGTLTDVDTLDGEIGFYTDQLTTGYWEVGVRVLLNPEQPLVSCGFIRIK